MGVPGRGFGDMGDDKTVYAPHSDGGSGGGGPAPEPRRSSTPGEPHEVEPFIVGESPAPITTPKPRPPGQPEDDEGIVL